jgi:hypothetical protein
VLHFPCILYLPALSSSRNLHCIFSSGKNNNFSLRFPYWKGRIAQKSRLCVRMTAGFAHVTVQITWLNLRKIYLKCCEPPPCLHSPPPPVAHQPLTGQGLVIIEALRSHSDTTHLVGFSGRVISPTQGPGDAKHLTRACLLMLGVFIILLLVCCYCW